MFVDLVGSTALSRKLDPEDLRQIIRSHQNTVAGEIARYQGFIAQFLGDGILLLFRLAHCLRVRRRARRPCRS